MLNKVPEVTIFFWVIKIMCTTVGETAADYLNENLGFGLTKTTYVTGALLLVLLAVQFRLRRYVPGVYWSVVVVISVFGTLITDNMTDRYNVPLTTSTIVFSIVLAVVFAVWYAVERTLSIHTIFTTPPRGLLLAGDPLHLRAGHRRRRPRRPRSSTSATPSRSPSSAGSSRRRHRALRVRAERGPRLLARLHPHPAARRLDRRRDVPEQPQVRRPRARHDRDELPLPGLHPGARHLPVDHAQDATEARRHAVPEAA